VSRTAVLAILSVALSGCVRPFAEERESHYADVATARRDSAFTRGWLPEIVPEDATNLWELHDLDSNATWACFTTPQGPTGVRSLLEKRGALRVGGPISSGPGRRWWPAVTSGPRVEGYRLREDARFTLLVGVDASGNRACFHRTGG
jgi:hypothetical protein